MDALKKLADQIEDERVQIYQSLQHKLGFDDMNDLSELNDRLFKLQSDLRDVTRELAYLGAEDCDE